MTTREGRLAALRAKREEISRRWRMYEDGDMRHLAKDAWDELEEVDREIAALSMPVPEAAPSRGEDYIAEALRVADEQLRAPTTLTAEERAAFAAGKLRLVLEVEFGTQPDGREYARVKLGKGPR